MQIIYETDRIILTPFSRELIKETESRYIKWFYDKEVTKYNSHGLFPYGKERMENYLDMCESGKEDIVWAIVSQQGLNHIGNISLQRFNWIYRSAEFAIIIGETEYHGQGIGFEVLSLLFKHGFDRLNLHRIWTGTAEPNTGMNELCKKLGMNLEGKFNCGTFINGKYENINCYSILEDEWRKINK